MIPILARLCYLGFWLTVGIPLAPLWHDWPSRVEPGGDAEELRERPLDVLIQWISMCWWLTIPPLILVWPPVPMLTQMWAVAAAYLLARRIAAMRGLGPGIGGWVRLLLRFRVHAAVAGATIIGLGVAHYFGFGDAGGDRTWPTAMATITWAWAGVMGLGLGSLALRVLGPAQAQLLRLRGQIAGVLGVTADELRPAWRGAGLVCAIPDRAATRTTTQITTAALAALPQWEVQREVGDDHRQLLWLTPVSAPVARQRRAGNGVRGASRRHGHDRPADCDDDGPVGGVARGLRQTRPPGIVPGGRPIPQSSGSCSRRAWIAARTHAARDCVARTASMRANVSRGRRTVTAGPIDGRPAPSREPP